MLRYPQNYGLDNDVDDDGWVYLVKVLPLPLFVRALAADIKTVVKESFSNNNASFEIVRRGEQLLIRAAHKRPTDPAVQVGALYAEPRLVDLGPPPPVPVERRLQPQHKTQRPWPRRRQFGIRGHGHDTMDSRTCANTGLEKTRSLPAQLLREAEASAPCSPRSAKMVPLAATEP